MNDDSNQFEQSIIMKTKFHTQFDINSNNQKLLKKML